MKQIKIKRELIELNPNFGQTSTKVPTKQTATFEIKGMVSDVIKNDENFVITEFNTISADYDDIVTKGYIKNPNEIGHNYPNNVSINIEQHYMTVYHEPIPKYSYEYDMNVKFKCSACGTEHLIKVIEEYAWDEYEVLDTTFCPNCDKYDTFDTWEFENIVDVLKEMNLN